MCISSKFFFCRPCLRSVLDKKPFFNVIYLIFQDSLEAAQVGEPVPVSAGAAGQRGHVRGSDLWAPRALGPVDMAWSPPGGGGQGPGQDPLWRADWPRVPGDPWPRPRGRGRVHVPGGQSIRGLNMHHHGESVAIHLTLDVFVVYMWIFFYIFHR